MTTDPNNTETPAGGPAVSRITNPSPETNSAAPGFLVPDSAAAATAAGPGDPTTASGPGLTAAGPGDTTVFANDSLAGMTARPPADPFFADSPFFSDSLAIAGFARFGAALPERPDFRPATAKEVFGPSTIAVVPVPSFRDEPFLPLTGNAFFQGAVLLLAAAYAILLYRHMADVRLLLSRLFHSRASSERLAEEPGSNSLSRFLKISNIIGLGFIGIAATKFADMFLTPETFPAALPLPAAPGVTLAFAVLWIAVATFQLLVLRTAGALTLAQRFIAQLRLLKRIYSALTVILAVPPFLLFALAPPGTGNGWLYASLAASAVTALLYLRESRLLFLAKKIPFLHWFLYLCIVEIFPFSLLWLTAAR